MKWFPKGRLRTVLHNAKLVCYAVLVLLAVAPIVLAILWITPIIIVLFFGIVLFLIFKILTVEPPNHP
jgi:hypothetical protein